MGQTSVPASIQAGSGFQPSITFKNVGSATWTAAANYFLSSRNPYANLNWGINRVNLSAPVSPQSNVTFTPNLTAPSTPGTYTFQWSMIHLSGFGDIPASVNIVVVQPDNAVFVSQIVGTHVLTGQQFYPSYIFKNTGTTTWIYSSGYWSVSVNPLSNTTWTLNRGYLPYNLPVAPGATVIIAPHVTAPSTPGTYMMQWRMSRNDVPFGQATTPVAIQVVPPNPEDAQYISETMPVLATAGQHYIAQITFKNIGSADWPLNTAVAYYPSMDGTWGLTYLATNSVITKGNSRTYNLDLLAPYAAGNYPIQFRMRDLDANTWFGQLSPVVTVSVSPGPYAQSPWPGYLGGRFRGASRGYGIGATGVKVWDFPVPNGGTSNAMICNPAIGADGTVYFGTDNNNFYALDGSTGALKWSFATGGQIWSGPCIAADGTVYFGSYDQKVYAVDGTTGVLKWSFSTNGQIGYCSPVLGPDGTLYCCSDGGTLYALNGSNGSVVWSRSVGSYARFTPVINNGVLYFGANSGAMLALDALNGNLVWSHQTTSYISGSAAIGWDGTLYFGSGGDHKIYALDGTTGAEKWSFLTTDYAESAPALGPDGIVYVCDYSKLYALDSATGQLLWSKNVSANWHDSP